MKIIGRQGYELLFKSARENTDVLKEILDSCGNFETLNDPELFIIIYRFIPHIARKQLAEWETLRQSKEGKESRELEKSIGRVNRIINALNIKLHKALRMDDTSFVSRTTLESTIYRPQNIVVLRAVLANPLTDKDILKEVVDTQNRIGMEIWNEFESAYRKSAG
jgi:glutamate decarboxylase